MPFVYYSHYPMNGYDYRQLFSIIANHIRNAVDCDLNLSVKVNEHYEISNCVKTSHWFTIDTRWTEIGKILLPLKHVIRYFFSLAPQLK
jgi:hypothetical protein